VGGSCRRVEMGPEERIKEAIRSIAQSKKNVTLDEILWVVNQLNATRNVSMRDARHGLLITIEGTLPFSICTHHKGSKQIKRKYVESFLDRMIDLGLFED
jgi:hypothetical protein